ncbi:hypothetical protein [Arthrobacter sp. 18067]|uniref:hypothetical protein n=1 Tax=Arthrobacter sp. 18067 TaxID=2681413 RepID=UPI00135897D5|nr:hypothetical protein [Arthrobacter sp. 18067]
MKLKLRSIVGASIGAFVLSIAAAGGANAISSSGTAYFDNGQPITANMWIQSLTAGTCGSFSSSAVMNVSPNYITNNTKFYQIGVGGISVSGVSASQVGGDPANLTWTNSNGARGSYMSGNVCGGWGMLYLGADVSASAFYYGNYRVATAHV